MRETSRSSDDLAVDAAKEKLASLRTRPGFEQAMVPEPGISRTPRRVALIAALLFLGLAAASYALVATTWLQVVLVLLFGAFAAVAALAGVGMPPEPATEPFLAVVLGKRSEPKDLRWVTLLDETGAEREVRALDDVWASLRAGDPGVAHVRSGTSPELVTFHRL